MGFDLYASNGKYFRNNVWWWRPLWVYVTAVCRDILSEDDIERGNYNDAHFIDENKAKNIAERLKTLIADGKTEVYALQRDKELQSLPDEICVLCDGTGKKEGKKCYKCDGKGKNRPFETCYSFTTENVKAFADFCEKSNGFEIC